MNCLLSRLVATLFFVSIPAFATQEGQDRENIYRSQQEQVVQHIPSHVSQELVPVASQNLELVPHGNPRVDIVRLPEFLSLQNSRRLRSACLSLMTPQAEVALNNIFTNLAYAQALELYGIHGDRLVKPFTDDMIGAVYKVAETSLLRATGLYTAIDSIDIFLKHFRALTGYGVRTRDCRPPIRRYFANWAARAPENIVGLLRLKPLTDLLNYHVVGKNVVAPYMAYGVHEVNFGRMLQGSLFGRVVEYLDSHQDQILERSDNELGAERRYLALLREELEELRSQASEEAYAELEARIVAQVKLIQDERSKVPEGMENQGIIKRTISGLAHSVTGLIVDNRSEEVKRLEDELNNIRSQKTLLDNKKKRLNDLPEIISQQEQKIARLEAELSDRSLALLDDENPIDLLDTLSNLEVMDFCLGDYMHECPHIQPGFVSGLLTMDNAQAAGSRLAVVSLGVLRYSGALDAMNRLQSDLNPEVLKAVFKDFARRMNSKIESGLGNELSRAVDQVSRRTVNRSSSLLMMGTYAAFNTNMSWQQIGSTVGRGIVRNAQESSFEVATEFVDEVAGPVINHGLQIYGNARSVYAGTMRILLPMRVIYHAIVYMPLIAAINYFGGYGFSSAGTFGMAFMIAILEELMNARESWASDLGQAPQRLTMIENEK